MQGPLVLGAIVHKFVLTAVAAVAAIVTLLPQAASAGRPAPTPTPTGNDISWPQCGKTVPSGQAFAIVGVNGGKASNLNPCFDAQWAWAGTSTGASAQAPAQLYLNTGNPGDVLAQYNVTTWPSSSVAADPYGQCAGIWTDDLPCSWQYGYDRASDDLAFERAHTGAAGWKTWLDIESSNSWTADPAKNQATLEGMLYALTQAGAPVGIYASSSVWGSLFGPVPATSPLYHLPEWRPGARTLSRAKGNCTLAPFAGDGRVEITQYVSNNLDYDYSCV